jgi:hypothetical protein
MIRDAWEQARELAEKHAAAGGMFVKLANDGDSVRGCFIGEPLVRQVFWNGERYENFDEDNPKHKGKKSALRLAINFFVLDENTVKVLELSATVIKDVLKLRDKYGFEKWSYEIERQGAAGDPKTKYHILPDEQLSDEQRQMLGDVDLHNLQALYEGGEDGAPARSHDDAGTIDEETAAELAAMLKPLARVLVAGFLKKFGIARVRELKARDAKTARRYVESLLPKRQDDDSIDPFA